jgi:predicted TPR repeat methyltransferase
LLTRATSPRRYRRALDLGAGTGLCGELLRPLCDAIVGVDLSRQMLARAATRGCYDALEHGDLLDYLERTEQRFDLFVAADSLVYLGDLDGCFADAARSALPGACLAVSLENGPDDGHELGLSGRYATARATWSGGCATAEFCARTACPAVRGDTTVAESLPFSSGSTSPR